jgi:hypothetical protein
LLLDTELSVSARSFVASTVDGDSELLPSVGFGTLRVARCLWALFTGVAWWFGSYRRLFEQAGFTYERAQGKNRCVMSFTVARQADPRTRCGAVPARSPKGSAPASVVGALAAGKRSAIRPRSSSASLPRASPRPAAAPR